MSNNNNNGFQLIDLTDGGQIKIGESTEDGSFVRTEGENPSITVKFNIFGAENASTAYLALLNYLHTWFDDGYGGIANYDLPLDTVRISTTRNNYAYTGECTFQFPMSGSSAESSSPSSDINSSDYSPPEIEDSDFTFSTVGGAAHLTYALAILDSARYNDGMPANYGGAINPSDDGTIGGCDVVRPAMAFSITLSLPKSWFNVAYRLTIANATGCINSQPWGGFASGCCLFKGVEAKAQWMKWTDPGGMARRDWYWRATYNFEASPSNYINVGSRVLYRRGYDVASMAKETYSDDSGNTVTEGVQVDILQVYPQFNFSQLGISMPN